MPLGPPGDPERFDTFRECVRTIMDPPNVTEEDAREVCGGWEANAWLAPMLAANQDVEDLVPGTPIDPPRVIPIQKRYSAKFYNQNRAIRGNVNTSIIELDALGLRTEPARPRALGQQFGPTSGFGFPTDPGGKRDAFRDWLDEQLRLGHVERIDHDVWVRAAYGRGIRHADHALRAQGIQVSEEELANIFQAPVHRDTLTTLLTRDIAALEGINAATGAAVSRKLADGLSQGWNPHKTAREINNEIEGIGLTRARMLARTETQNAVAEGTLNRFQQAGVEEVAAFAEFSTAGDERVCPECLALEGNVYTVEAARGLIPVHPNCRCVWLPVDPANVDTRDALIGSEAGAQSVITDNDAALPAVA